MSPEEAAWQALGAPFPLVEVPKPSDLPDDTSTTSIPVVDPDAAPCGLTVGQMRAFIGRYRDLAASFVQGPKEDWHTWVQVSEALDGITSSLEDAFVDAEVVPAKSRLQYTVRWDDTDGPLYHSVKSTISEAQEVLDAVTTYTGVIVQRTVTTSDLVEVAS